jgi:hypothetical protein
MMNVLFVVVLLLLAILALTALNYAPVLRVLRLDFLISDPDEMQDEEAALRARNRKIRAMASPVAQWTARMYEERFDGRLKAWLRRGVLTILSLLYGVVVMSVFSVFSCDKINTTVRLYMDLYNDGSMVRHVGLDPSAIPAVCYARSLSTDACPNNAVYETPITIRVLSSNPQVVCSESAHRSAIALAVTTFVFYILAYPAVTFLIVRGRLRQMITDSLDFEAWQAARLLDKERQQNWINDTPNGRFRQPLMWCRRVRAVLFKSGVRYGLPDRSEILPFSAVFAMCGCRPRASKKPDGKSRLHVMPSSRAPLSKGKSGDGLASCFESFFCCEARLGVEEKSAHAERDQLRKATRLPESATSVMTVFRASASSEEKYLKTVEQPQEVGNYALRVRRALARRLAVSKKAKEYSSDEILDSCREVQRNISFASFLNQEFRPSHFWMKHVDFAVMFMMAIIIIFMTEAKSTGEAAGRFFLSQLVIQLFVVFLIGRWPYVDKDRWLLYIKVLALELAALASLVALVFYSSPPSVEGKSSGPAKAVSAVFVIAFVVFIIFLVISLGVYLKAQHLQAEVDAQDVRRELEELEAAKEDVSKNEEVFGTDDTEIGDESKDMEDPSGHMTTEGYFRAQFLPTGAKLHGKNLPKIKAGAGRLAVSAHGANATPLKPKPVMQGGQGFMVNPKFQNLAPPKGPKATVLPPAGEKKFVSALPSKELSSEGIEEALSNPMLFQASGIVPKGGADATPKNQKMWSKLGFSSSRTKVDEIKQATPAEPSDTPSKGPGYAVSPLSSGSLLQRFGNLGKKKQPVSTEGRVYIETPEQASVQTLAAQIGGSGKGVISNPLAATPKQMTMPGAIVTPAPMNMGQGFAVKARGNNEGSAYATPTKVGMHEVSMRTLNVFGPQGAVATSGFKKPKGSKAPREDKKTALPGTMSLHNVIEGASAEGAIASPDEVLGKKKKKKTKKTPGADGSDAGVIEVMDELDVLSPVPEAVAPSETKKKKKSNAAEGDAAVIVAAPIGLANAAGSDGSALDAGADQTLFFNPAHGGDGGGEKKPKKPKKAKADTSSADASAIAMNPVAAIAADGEKDAKKKKKKKSSSDAPEAPGSPSDIALPLGNPLLAASSADDVVLSLPDSLADGGKEVLSPAADGKKKSKSKKEKSAAADAATPADAPADAPATAEKTKKKKKKTDGDASEALVSPTAVSLDVQPDEKKKKKKKKDKEGKDASTIAAEDA